MEHGDPIFNQQAQQLYVYHSLGKARDIRLLTLQPSTEEYDDSEESDDPNESQLVCTIKPVPLDECGVYDALSYVWGDTSDRKPLFCSGELLMITSNLHTALSQFRRDGRLGPIWVDAICINQNDLDERSKQVQMMGDIYANARCTLVWLGLSSDDDCDAVVFMMWLTATVSSFPEYEKCSNWADLDWSKVTMRLGPALADGYNGAIAKPSHLAKLVTRPWFQRVWVIQEVAKADEVHMLWGDSEYPFDSFRIAVEIFSRCTLDVTLHPDLRRRYQSAYKGVARLGNCKDAVANKGMDMFQAMCLARDAESTDARDKVYALLGMARKSATFLIEPSYRKSAAVVFREVAVADLIESKQLRTLSCASYQNSTQGPHDLPSWIPDWSMPHAGMSFIVHSNLDLNVFEAAKGSNPVLSITADLRILTLRGKMLCHVSKAVTRDYHPAFEQISVDEDAPARLRSASRACRTFELFLQWLKECHLIGLGWNCLVPEAYEDSVYDSFARALMCDSFGNVILGTLVDAVGQVRSLCREAEAQVSMLKFCLQNLSQDLGWEIATAEGRTLSSNLSNFEDLNRRISVHEGGRRFCRTDSGHLGWAPRTAEAGDCICMFYGGQVLYVLRPVGDDRYRLIGECYLQGFMHGEAVQMTEIADQDFHIQ